MLRIKLLLGGIIAVWLWIHPALAISALWTEPQLENPQFINYELHRENLKSVRDEQRANDGRGVLQPEQNLQSGNNQPSQKLDEQSETKPNKSASANQNSNQGTSKNKEYGDSKINISSTARAYNGRNYSKEEVQNLIRKYSAQYGIDSEAPLCIAKLESGFNPNNKNPKSSASGVFQYVKKTWNGTDEGKAGRNVFDADANVKAAIKYMASRKSTQPWEVRSKCPPIKTIN